MINAKPASRSITLKFNWGSLMAEWSLGGKCERLKLAAAKLPLHNHATASQRADMLFRLYGTSNISGALGRLECS